MVCGHLPHTPSPTGWCCTVRPHYRDQWDRAFSEARLSVVRTRLDDMSTWEERMAERARARRRARGEGPDPLRVSEHDEAIAAARAQYIAAHPGSDSPTPPDPHPDDYCRECSEWLPLGNWPDVYGWKVTCQFKCGHAHHDDEVWLARE